MKFKIKSYLTIGILLCTSCMTSHAQGVVFYKKDGTNVKVSYKNLDNIETYMRKKNKPIDENTKRIFTVNGVTFSMIPVKAGTFKMGFENGNKDESPIHEVTLTSDYYIGESEVTQALWEAVTGKVNTLCQSKYGRGKNFPIYSLSYEDALQFIIKLNNITGENFCLPTEAEWEYAAKGGNKSNGYIYSGSNTLKEVGWYKTNSNKLQEVKLLSPNELGIYDMNGNVGEMCIDWYSNDYYSSSDSMDPMGPKNGTKHVIRGGAYENTANDCRITRRYESLPPIKVGIRLVLK